MIKQFNVKIKNKKKPLIITLGYDLNILGYISMRNLKENYTQTHLTVKMKD